MNDFFLFEEKVSSSRNFDFCVFDDSTKQKIFDVIINIFAHQMFHFIMKSETIIIKIKRSNTWSKSAIKTGNHHGICSNVVIVDFEQVLVKEKPFSILEQPGHDRNLAALFNNRSACHLKIGDCGACIKDTTKSLQFAQTPKAYLRRATAYETKEK